MPRPARISLLLAGALISGPAQGKALARCVGAAPGSTISLRVDNDALGAQDQGYSNGIQALFASANLDDWDDSEDWDDPDDRDDLDDLDGDRENRDGLKVLGPPTALRHVVSRPRIRSTS